MQDDTNRKLGERVSVVETNQSYLAAEVEKHQEAITDLKDQLGSLVSEVKSIKKALYVMAAALAANVPALQPIFGLLKHIF